MVFNLLHTKETIVFTAVDVLNEFGVQNLSTKEIAKRVGIAEATIYKHFKTKSDLLIAVLDYFTQYDSDIFISTKDRIDNPLEAITFFVKSYAEYYENYPAITAISQAYDVTACNPDLSSRVKRIFMNRIEFISELLSAAKKAGQLSPKTDTQKLADIIWGVENAICLKWRFSGYSFSLKDYTLSTLKMLLDAYSKK